MLQTAHTFEHTPKKKKPAKPYIKGFYGNFKWYLQESNQGHTDFQSVALPTELRYLPCLRASGCKYNFKITTKK